MARYGTFLYGTTEYGAAGNLSSTSLSAIVLGYDEVKVTISSPERVDKEFILTRSYNGAAETPNDGVVVLRGTVEDSITYYTDSSTNSGVSLTPGWCYYTLFVVDTDLSWVKDAATSILIPKDRGTNKYLMENLPSVLTSEDYNPLTPVDYNGALARFLRGFSLTFDELQGHVDSVLGDSSTREVVRRLDPTRAVSVGMPDEYTIGTAASHRLYKQAGYIYRNKGSLDGIAAYVKALTGWDTQVYNGFNLLLDLDDSSFEASVGNWDITGGTLARAAVNGTTVTSCNLYDAQTGPLFDFKRAGVGVVTLTSASATLTLPSSGLLKNVPVPYEALVGDSYTFVVPVRATSGTPTVTARLTWLDKDGTAVGSMVAGSGLVTSSSWASASVTSTVPADAKYVGLSIAVAGSSTNAVHLDMLYFGDTQTPFYYWDARSVDIVCNPALVNQIMDPTLDDADATYYQCRTGVMTISDEESRSGLTSLKLVGSTDFFAYHLPTTVKPLNYYTARLAAKGTGTLEAYVEWYDSDFVLISTSDSVDFGTVDAVWDDRQIVVLAPEDAAYAMLVFDGTGTVYIDTIVFADATNVSTFFSGSVGNSDGSDVDWYGTTGSSISTLYPNKPTKLSRLRDTIDYYLPMGVSWRVLLWGDSPVISNVVDYIPTVDDMTTFISERAVLYLDADLSGSGQTVTNLGTSGAALNATLGSTGSADSNDPEPLVFAGTSYVYLPGLANNSLSVPTIVSVASSTDKFVWVDVELPDWTPSASASRLIGTRGGTSTGYELMIRSGGTLEFQWRDSGTVSWRSRTSSALGFTDGTRHLIGASIDLDNGAGGVTCRFWESTDQGATWTQIGTDQTMATVAAIAVGTDAIEIGTRGASNDPLVGKVYGGGIYNAIDGSGKPSGAAALTVDCSVLTSGSATSFTATVGGTATINRSTSGRKSVAVVDSVWLFGSDDYMEIADHADLDFGASDSFTVLAVARFHAATPGERFLVAKRNATPAANVGWLLQRFSDNSYYTDIGDGSVRAVDGQVAGSLGGLDVVAGVRDTTIDKVYTYVAGTSTTQTTDGTTTTLANALPVRIGCASSSATGIDMELYAVAVIRKALSLAEIALITDHYNKRK